MKKYLTLATAALLMAACSEKPGYTISGTVANADLNGKYVYLYEYGAKDAAPLDSALIANGQFSLTGSQDSPRLCELKVNTGDAGEQGYQTVFVLENGQLQARMDAKSSAVSGTAENDAFVSLNTSLETLFQGERGEPFERHGDREGRRPENRGDIEPGDRPDYRLYQGEYE